MIKKTFLICASLALGLSLMVSTAHADGINFNGTLGARMYATGGVISAKIGPCYAGYNSMVSLFTYDSIAGLTLIGDMDFSQALGATYTTPSAVAAGTEIVVGINANSKNTTVTNKFYSGLASLNPDGKAHAKVDFLGINPSFGGPVLVGFEDLWIPGSDLDYNDAVVVSLSGVREAVPEPMTIMLGIMGLASVAGFGKLRKSA